MWFSLSISRLSCPKSCLFFMYSLLHWLLITDLLSFSFLHEMSGFKSGLKTSSLSSSRILLKMLNIESYLNSELTTQDLLVILMSLKFRITAIEHKFFDDSAHWLCNLPFLGSNINILILSLLSSCMKLFWVILGTWNYEPPGSIQQYQQKCPKKGNDWQIYATYLLNFNWNNNLLCRFP